MEEMEEQEEETEKQTEKEHIIKRLKEKWSRIINKGKKIISLIQSLYFDESEEEPNAPTIFDYSFDKEIQEDTTDTINSLDSTVTEESDVPSEPIQDKQEVKEVAIVEQIPTPITLGLCTLPLGTQDIDNGESFESVSSDSSLEGASGCLEDFDSEDKIYLEPEAEEELGNWRKALEEREEEISEIWWLGGSQLKKELVKEEERIRREIRKWEEILE